MGLGVGCDSSSGRGIVPSTPCSAVPVLSLASITEGSFALPDKAEIKTVSGDIFSASCSPFSFPIGVASASGCSPEGAQVKGRCQLIYLPIHPIATLEHPGLCSQHRSPLGRVAEMLGLSRGGCGNLHKKGGNSSLTKTEGRSSACFLGSISIFST